MTGAGRQLELGLNLPYVEGSMEGRTPHWTDILAMGTTAESIGFDGLWISDHVGFGDPEGRWRGAWDSWTLLAALAPVTSRVTLAPYVLAVPLRNPALLAKMAETLDEVSRGRFILGLGAGWNEPEFTSYGLPFDDRFRRFEESLRIIAEMLRTGRSTLAGETVQTRSARLEPRGPRPNGLPIMIGTTGPRMLRLTAELADHWNGGLRRIEEVPPLLEAVEAACAAVGRDPATLTKSIEVLVRTLPATDGARPDDREIGGGPEPIAAELRKYADLGIDHLQVQLRPNNVEGVEAFAPVIERMRE
jgi:probable F420-dependent oxidoreductase